jgi:hypothetical protein
MAALLLRIARLGVIAFLAVACAPVTPVAPASDTPAAVVERFYAMHLAESGAGLPDARRMPAYRAFLTKALLVRIARAQQAQQAYLLAHPGDKPPWIEGALFASLFEGYTHARVLTVASEGDRASVPVEFVYDRGAGRTQWTDTVLLRREDGAWRIDDVEFGGTWDFANHGRLSDMLVPAE